MGIRKVLHNNHDNPRSDYSLLASGFETTEFEKDLGVMICSGWDTDDFLPPYVVISSIIE